MSKLPKDVELTLRYLQEVMRHDKSEMLVGSTNAFFDALFQHISVLNNNKYSKQNISSTIILVIIYYKIVYFFYFDFCRLDLNKIVFF